MKSREEEDVRHLVSNRAESYYLKMLQIVLKEAIQIHIRMLS